LSVVGCQLSVVSCRLSVVGYQLLVIGQMVKWFIAHSSQLIADSKTKIL
jgi:hypothetical protein